MNRWLAFRVQRANAKYSSAGSNEKDGFTRFARRLPSGQVHSGLFRWGDASVTAAFSVRKRLDWKAVDKRIDVIAAAIQFRGTVHDLAEAELCYAPQFGAAKDPVNLAGMLAENVLNGDMLLADWLELERTDALLVDVREPDEFADGHIPNAINLPLSQMRERYSELPTNREIWTYCRVGQRGYFATRFLAQHGYRSRNLSGGYTTYQAFRTAFVPPQRFA